MNHLSIDEIENYVKKNIGKFHESRLGSLENLDFDHILKRKNPYLYKVKNLGVAHDIVKDILDAHISSSEETKFGEWLRRNGHLPKSQGVRRNEIVFRGDRSRL